MSLTYRASIVPRELNDIPAFLQSEYRKLERSFQDAQEHISLKISHAAPAKVFPGKLVYADGVDWNPGSGPGLYIRNQDNTEWAYIGGVADVRLWGASPGSTEDQSSYFHAAFDAAQDVGLGAIYAEGTFRFTNDLVLRSGVQLVSSTRSSLHLEMDGCSVTHEIRAGNSVACRDTGARATIESVNGDDETGLLLQGVQYSDWDVRVEGFNGTSSTGIKSISGLDNATYRYSIHNRFWDIEVVDCYKGVHLTKAALDPATFGSNFNTMYGGYINGYTSVGLHVEYGERNIINGTRCTTNIVGAMGMLIEDSVTTLIAPTADGSYGGSVPGTTNTYGFPHGRNGDTTSVGIKFTSRANGSLLVNFAGDGCYERITFDSQATKDKITIFGRNTFNHVPDMTIKDLTLTDEATCDTVNHTGAYSHRLSIADDAVSYVELSASARYGRCDLVAKDGTLSIRGAFYYRTGTSHVIQTAADATGFTAAAADTTLTGTTGADGAFTVSAADNGLYFENRTGGTKTILVQLFTDNA